MRISHPGQLVLVSVLAFAGSGLVGACAGAEGATNQAEQASERFAVIALSWGASESGQPSARDAVAAGYVFDHAAGERAAILARLGLGWATLLDANVGADQCIIVHDGASAAGQVPAHLLDAGELTVETAEGATRLEASYTPEDWPPATGVLYSGLVPMGARVGEQQIGVRAAGSDVVDGPDVVGRFGLAMRAPETVRLTGLAESAAGLEVQWSQAARAVADRGSEQVIVSYERRGFGDAWTVACAVDDDGAFVLPAALLNGLPGLGGAADRTDHLVVRRIASVSFSARGVPNGVVLAVSEDAALVGE